jgi:hypothetical protein
LNEDNKGRGSGGLNISEVVDARIKRFMVFISFITNTGANIMSAASGARKLSCIVSLGAATLGSQATHSALQNLVQKVQQFGARHVAVDASNEVHYLHKSGLLWLHQKTAHFIVKIGLVVF